MKTKAYARKLQRLGLSDEELGSLDDADEDDERLPVHVLVCVPKPKGAEIAWLSERCEQLTFVDDPVIQIPWIYLRGTRISRFEQDLMLYRRTQVMNKWSQIRVCSVNTHA